MKEYNISIAVDSKKNTWKYMVAYWGEEEKGWKFLGSFRTIEGATKFIRLLRSEERRVKEVNEQLKKG